jgi:predicted MFS family arabinose efflux permease
MSAYSARAARPLTLASAGIGVIGASFGMARYGFGLLAPDIRASFHLDNGSIGLLSAASYAAYLITSIAAGALAARLGPRMVVAAGGLCAVAGMLIAGIAANPSVLFAGLLVAGASAGLVFPPFSDVVSGFLARASRARVLAAISSGTGWGVALAAPMALLAGQSWRTAWLLFALVAALATAWALTVLPPRRPSAPAEVVRLKPSWFLCPRSTRLLMGALLVGLASSIYWTFAVEHLQSQGDLSTTQSRLFLAVVGLALVGGTVGADAIDRLGARAAFILAAAAEAASLLLLGLTPDAPPAALTSALLFGVAYATIVAIAVIWSAKIFAEQPSAGLAAVMVMNAVGLLIGPPALGAVADHTGLTSAFIAGTLLMLLTTALAPAEELRRAGQRGLSPRASD